MQRLIFTALLVSVFPAAGEVLRLSEPVASDSTTETYGSTLNDTPPIALSELMSDKKTWLTRPAKVETRVAKVCQKKGCFFIAQEGDLAVRVSFVDYSFFVPTDIGNKVVTLEGQLVERQLSKAEADHFNADMGDGNLSPGVTYELVATGVRVPKST